ncbi:MvdC/MvdD family ATP grasp protein [Embleya sp. NPDC020886]|uniref:MvdC/MvdD family ATP grasp protein n=1 Tax=Embleya sp. NPDC020886 TaxID=3363980 RepID=UPI0037B9AB3F
MLVATGPVDPTADLVITELNQRGIPCARIDPGGFPRDVTLDATLSRDGVWHGHLAQGTRRIALEDICAVYWRRPTTIHASATPAGPERDFAEREARLGLSGILAALPDVTWVNDPARAAACTKPAQLAAFRAAGLDTPDTWIGNAPAAHGRFCADHAPAIGKTLGPITHTDATGARHVVNTTRVPDAYAGHPRIASTAHLVQAEVRGRAFEYRVAVVGERLFTTEIHVDAPYLDIRTAPDEHTTYRPGTLPAALARRVVSVTRDFGLVFAAWDLIATRDHRVFALELNPGGQWGFVPGHHHITTAIVDHLEHSTR